jgi:hypothetical protein
MIERSLRYRVNISTSVKGVKTWDCTVDGEGFSMTEILLESDALVAELEERYPITITVEVK